MTDRTTIPADEDVVEFLRQNKGEYETWNEYLIALGQLAEEYHEPVTLGSND